MSIVPCPHDFRNYRQKELELRYDFNIANAPALGNWVDANMQVRTFADNQLDLFLLHADLQHDYVSGTDLDFHIHWGATTTSTGAVKWQIYYQWFNSNSTWTAAQLLTSSTVADGTLYKDYTTHFIIPSSGQNASSRLLVKLFRDGNDVADTFTGGAAFHACGCHYIVRLSQYGNFQNSLVKP